VVSLLLGALSLITEEEGLSSSPEDNREAGAPTIPVQWVAQAGASGLIPFEHPRSVLRFLGPFCMLRWTVSSCACFEGAQADKPQGMYRKVPDTNASSGLLQIFPSCQFFLVHVFFCNVDSSRNNDQRLGVGCGFCWHAL